MRFAIMLALCVLLLMPTGCAAASLAPTPTLLPLGTPLRPGSGASFQEPIPMGATARTVDDLEVTVRQVTVRDGKVFITVHVAYRGTASEPKAVSYVLYSLVTSAQRVYGWASRSAYADTPPLGAYLLPGGETEGFIIWFLPQGEQPILLMREFGRERIYFALH